MRKRVTNSSRKVRQTFSVGRDVVDLLDRLRTRRNLRSRSAALEAVVREQHAAERNRAVSQSITDFYDSLSDADRAEEQAWGAFSVEQWSKRKE